MFNLPLRIQLLSANEKICISAASVATGRLQITPSGSGDENGRRQNATFEVQDRTRDSSTRKFAFV